VSRGIDKIKQRVAPKLKLPIKRTEKLVSQVSGHETGLERPVATKKPAVRKVAQQLNQHHKGNTTQKRDKAAECKQPKKSAGSRQSKFELKKLQNEVNSYHCSDIYVKMLDSGFMSKNALDTFNVWVKNNLSNIRPDLMCSCFTCGEPSIYACEHYIIGNDAKVCDEEIPVVTKEVRLQNRSNSFWRRLVGSPLPHMDLSVVNNHHCKDLINDNFTVPDNLIDEELYSFLRLKMHSSYSSRVIKLEHCSRLVEIYLTKNKINPKTVYEVNIIKLTQQRACDSHENDVLLKENDPEMGFQIDWFNFLAILLGLIVLLIVPVLSIALLLKFLIIAITIGKIWVSMGRLWRQH
jgi:hypothetical protein